MKKAQCSECGRDGGYPLYCMRCAEEMLKQSERTWVGLTDEEAQQAFKRHNCDISKDLAGILARAIEAKLKDKNSC